MRFVGFRFNLRTPDSSGVLLLTVVQRFYNYYLCPMRIDIITVVPELLESPFSHSILKRAKEKGLLDIHVHQLRKWAINKHGQVDDYQFGGGAGMVMMCESLIVAIERN